MNFNMPDADKMENCPYNRSHRVHSRRFMIHLVKCRRNYVASQILNGQPKPMKLVCQYNPDHEVLGPELDHHEENCSDRNTSPRSYQLVVEPWINYYGPEAVNWLPAGGADLFSPEELEKEHAEMFAGTFVGNVLAAGYPEEKQSIESVKNLTPEEDSELRKLFRHKYPAKILGGEHRKRREEAAKNGKEGETAEGDGETEEGYVESYLPKKDPVVEEVDSDEDWGKDQDPSEPGFDYRANIWSGKNCHPSQVPSCLTKIEKKLYLKVHGKRMEEEKQRIEEEKRRIEEEKFKDELEYKTLYQLQYEQWQEDSIALPTILDNSQIKEETDRINKGHDLDTGGNKGASGFWYKGGRRGKTSFDPNTGKSSFDSIRNKKQQ